MGPDINKPMSKVTKPSNMDKRSQERPDGNKNSLFNHHKENQQPNRL